MTCTRDSSDLSALATLSIYCDERLLRRHCWDRHNPHHQRWDMTWESVSDESFVAGGGCYKPLNDDKILPRHDAAAKSVSQSISMNY